MSGFLKVTSQLSGSDLSRSLSATVTEGLVPLWPREHGRECAPVHDRRDIPTLPSLHQAFVKMVGHHVSFLEDHVLQAERDHGAFPQALRRWLGSAGLPSFRTVSISPPPTASEALERGEGLRKQEFKGHTSFLQTGNGVWPARAGRARVAGCLSPSLGHLFLP